MTFCQSPCTRGSRRLSEKRDRVICSLSLSGHTFFFFFFFFFALNPLFWLSQFLPKSLFVDDSARKQMCP